MKPIKQLHNACFLACIESFLKDHSISKSQAEMIKVLKGKGLCSEEGVVRQGDEGSACKEFNIRFTDVPYKYPIPQNYSDGSLLIGTTQPGLHCVRFLKQEEEAKIIVMDPAIGDFRYWDKPDLEKSIPLFHKIELEQAK